MTAVLVVTGPIGVGKSAVLHSVDALLADAAIPHATVVLEEISRCWAARPGDALPFRNLAALWSNYAALGARRLLLEMLVEHRAELAPLAEAVPGARITVVRLRAPLSRIEERIRRREPEDPDDELHGARWWAPRMDRSAAEDFVVDTGDRTVRDVAVEVLRVAGWLATGA